MKANTHEKTVHYIGLDVHKDLRRLGSAEKNVQSTSHRPSEWERTSPTIAIAIAPENTGEVRAYDIIGGTLVAVDKLIKNPPRPKWNCALFTKPAHEIAFSTPLSMFAPARTS